jgi:hypothetical protein
LKESIPVTSFKPPPRYVANCKPGATGIEPMPSVTFSNYAEFVEALLAAKNYLDLSNEHVEHMIRLCAGHVDKNLGPSRAKNIGPALFDDYLECFAIRFRMEVNPEAFKRMEPRWEGRDKSRVRRYTHSISNAVMTRAKSVFHQEKSQQLANGRKKIAPKKRRAIARKAARARWRKRKRPASSPRYTVRGATAG